MTAESWQTPISRRALVVQLGVAPVLLTVAGLAGCGGAAAPASSATVSTSAKSPPSATAASASAKPAASPSGSAAPSTGSAPGKELLNVGLLSSVSDAGFYVGMDKGFYAEQGLELKTNSFQSAAYMVAPLSESQLDVGGGATSAGLDNAMTRDIGIKIVADKGSVPMDSSFQALMIRGDHFTSGRFKGQYGELKGMTLADTAEGNSGHVSMGQALEKGGLSFKDVDHVFMGFPEMAAAFAGKSIDGALVIEPFVTQIAAKGAARIFKRSNDFSPNHQVAVVLYSPKFMSDRKDVADRFMVAYLKSLRLYNDAFFNQPRDQQAYGEVVDILARHTPVKDKALYAQMVMPGLDPDGKLLIDSLGRDQEWYLANGYQKQKVNMADAVDQGFAQRGVKQLGGPYSK